MRKTKVVCTIGPASSNKETIKRMCLAGMNVARLNFSHGTHEEHKRNIKFIKEVREELNLPVAILLDTKGPEYRIGIFENNKIFLNDDDVFVFTTDDIIGNKQRVSVSYKGLPEEVTKGDRILLNNGLVIFEVVEVKGNDIICNVVTGGEVSNRKSMSFPNKVLKQVYLSEQDKKDLIFGIANGIDFIACSFVSNRQDLIDIKRFLEENGHPDVELIAKIENQSGIDNIDEICKECSGIMIGRGDMGVEIAYEKLPAIQKHLITKCRMLGRFVITATEMLESMIYNPRPTRAEISDVANAVYDGSGAVMLSGETAAGKYPAEAVETMTKIICETEQNIHYEKRFNNNSFKIKSTIDAISHAICGMAIDLKASGIVVCSYSGMTARMISRFRPTVDIVGLTSNTNIWRKLALSWGITPVMVEEYPSAEVLFYVAQNKAKDILGLKDNDCVIIAGNATNGKSGTTDLIKIEKV